MSRKHPEKKTGAAALSETLGKIFDFKAGRAYRCRPEIAQFNSDDYVLVDEGRFSVHRSAWEIEQAVIKAKSPQKPPAR